jgi:hypothetical protein
MPSEQQLSNTFEGDLRVFSFKRSAKHGWSTVTVIHVSPGRLTRKENLLALRCDEKQVVKLETERDGKTRRVTCGSGVDSRLTSARKVGSRLCMARAMRLRAATAREAVACEVGRFEPTDPLFNGNTGGKKGRK